MHVNVQVDGSTLPHQFVALSNLFRELSGVPASSYVQPPADPAELAEPEVTVIAEDKPATTKRRRTKAEIAADEAAAEATNAARSQVEVEQLGAEGSKVAAAEAAAQASNEVALAEIKAAEQVKVDEFEKVAVVTGNKTFTEAEAQQLATLIARTKGPTLVKDKIAELGATRIGDLTADQLNELGNFLETQK